MSSGLENRGGVKASVGSTPACGVYDYNTYTKNGTAPDLSKEIGSARNIKDRQTRNNTLNGLNKIKQYL